MWIFVTVVFAALPFRSRGRSVITKLICRAVLRDAPQKPSGQQYDPATGGALLPE